MTIRDLQWAAGLSRRDFMRASAVAGAGMLLSRGPNAAEQAPASEGESGAPEVNVAIIGTGSQGRILIQSGLKIPGIRFRAVCDIWEYSQLYASRYLQKYGHDVNVYEDYRVMLDKEQGLDAVLIATPDFVHAPQAIACLEAGLDVYCEKEMSNSLEAAADMVRAARRTGRLMQIGHQRRSNPRYLHALKLIYNDKVLGRITSFEGQWNRPVQDTLGWPDKYAMEEAKLLQYGYASMLEFRNWRWFRKYSGGPISDLGSHQVDVYSWFMQADPVAVMATGGLDYYDNREWYDNVIALYDYKTDQGMARGSYQVCNTSSHGGYSETFMGDEGSLVISEDPSVGRLYREKTAKKREWEAEAEKITKMDREAIELKIGETRTASGERPAEALEAMEAAKKPVHQPHLENFFAAIREGAGLNCDAEEGYRTAVAVLNVNRAVATGEKIAFKPEDFVVA